MSPTKYRGRAGRSTPRGRLPEKRKRPALPQGVSLPSPDDLSFRRYSFVGSGSGRGAELGAPSSGIVPYFDS
jgi:hypothetical protein